MTCKLPYCKKCSGVYKILPAVALIILLYFFVLRMGLGVNNPGDVPGNDFMNRLLFEMRSIRSMFGEACCSMWPITHFVLYFVLGLLFPDCDVLIMGLGVLWEVFEVGFSMYEGTGDKYQPVVHYDSRGRRAVEYTKSWWMGSYKDIMFNAAGFYTAKLLLCITGRRGVCIKHLNDDTSECDKVA